MSGKRAEWNIKNLGRAMSRLKEAIDEPETNKLAIDGTIQRFEFVFELTNKAMRHLLAHEGITVTTPREALKQAFRVGWLQDETAWLQMLEDRNETSHIYNEDVAREIYGRIREEYPEMVRTYEVLRGWLEREREEKTREEGGPSSGGGGHGPGGKRN